MNCRACNEPILGRAAWAWYCHLCLLIGKKIKRAASSKVFNKTLHGGWPKAYDLKCADCGERAVAYEHRDYFDPLNVVPVCDHCNKARGPSVQFDGQVQHFLVEA